MKNYMKTMVFAIALAASVTGCKKKDGGAETAGSAAAPAAPAAPAAVAPAAAAAGLPAECNDYKTAVDALAKCDKLPAATRDAFKQSYDQLAASAANLPPEGKAGLAMSCKGAVDAMKQATASLCP